MKNNMSDKMFIIGGAFCVVAGIVTMGIWFLSMSSGGSTGGQRINPVEEVEESNVVETFMSEIKAMSVLELLDLKDKIEDFKNTTTDFEMSVSGILEVFK